MNITFKLIFTPDIFHNNKDIGIDVNDKFDTDYIAELFNQKIEEIKKLIKETERELF